MNVPPIRKPGPRPEPTQPIHDSEVYDMHEFCRRVGWSRTALTTARREGLRAVMSGGRLFIRGVWFHEYLERTTRGNEAETA
jgi:hypothetical protein